jgi:hypothetical protein
MRDVCLGNSQPLILTYVEADGLAVIASLQHRLNELKAQLKSLPLRCSKGLAGWIAQLNPQQFELLEDEVTEWSRLPPENDEPDGIAYALDYFRDLDPEICDLLGVSIIEGDHPGSSYFAAELDISVEEANQIATEHEIPIRFFQ